MAMVTRHGVARRATAAVYVHQVLDATGVPGRMIFRYAGDQF